MREAVAGFSQGDAVIAVCGAPFKCPPAPSECALLLHDHLVGRGVRDACEITLVLPFGEAGAALAGDLGSAARAFAERGITFVAEPQGERARPARAASSCSTTAAELPYDLFLGVPKHRAPDVVVESGITEDGYVPVDPATLETRFPGVYARRRRDRRDAEGRRVRGRRRARARDVADRAARGAASRPASTPAPAPATSSSAAAASGASTSTSSRAEADRHLPGAVRRAARREGALRREPPRPLVRLHVLSREPV